MAAVALNLTPTVEVLLDHPFDSTALQRAHSAVNGHPHAYATALRCAAKRTDNPLAAAYWLTEAARVHESVDDLGGAIALLSRAWECDRTNARTREILAGCMARLSIRIGIGFTATALPPGVSPVSDATIPRPAPIESGLRPPPMGLGGNGRDTLPGLFGLELLAVDVTDDTAEAPAALPAEPPAEEKPAETVVVQPAEDPVLKVVADLAMGAATVSDSTASLAAARNRRDALFPPPPGPEGGSEPSAAPIPLSLARPRVQESALAVEQDAGTPTLRSSGFAEHPETIRQPAPELPSEDAYGDATRVPTVRPAGDGLVGAVFEALHELHFVEDAKEAAHFVRRVIEEKMKPSVALVHLYDINTRHFVVMSAAGSRAEVLADYETPDDDPLASEIMRGDEAMLVLDPATDPRLSKGRWRLAEPKKSVLCAPVAVEGRYLGLLEIADPIDGSEFGEEDRNVFTYVANAFAKYLNTRGVVLGSGTELDNAMAW